VAAIAVVRWFGKRYYYLVDDTWCLSSGKPASTLAVLALDREFDAMHRAREIHRVLTKGVQS
jgi:hypothetical protein